MKLWPASRAGIIRITIAFFALLIAAYFAHFQDYYYFYRYEPKEGDVIFQSLPHNDLVDAIEGITHSPYSHCGVVLQNAQGIWIVIEAIGDVHETHLLHWIERGRGGDFTVYRLDSKYDAVISKFREALLAREGQPYDYDYDMSGNNGVYCSSLVYLAFQQASGEQMGKLEKLRDLDWKPFAGFIMTEQAGHLPLDRVMITPASLARAPQLHEVYRSGL
jgi:hypothetical protein